MISLDCLKFVSCSINIQTLLFQDGNSLDWLLIQMSLLADDGPLIPVLTIETSFAFFGIWMHSHPLLSPLLLPLLLLSPLCLLHPRPCLHLRLRLLEHHQSRAWPLQPNPSFHKWRLSPLQQPLFLRNISLCSPPHLRRCRWIPKCNKNWFVGFLFSHPSSHAGVQFFCCSIWILLRWSWEEVYFWLVDFWSSSWIVISTEQWTSCSSSSSICCMVRRAFWFSFRQLICVSCFCLCISRKVARWICETG